MKYIPIFSKDLEKFDNKNICIIGKIIDIQEEKKMLRLKLIDTFGYVNILFFEYFDVKLFDTVLILGKVSNYNNSFSVIGKYIIKLNENDEILWRKFFIEKIIKRKTFKEKEDNKTMEEGDENMEKQDDLYKKLEESDYLENEDIKLRKEILEFIKSNDNGNGVSYDDIIKFFEIDEEKISNVLKDLLSSGEIYESSPNKYKII